MSLWAPPVSKPFCSEMPIQVAAQKPVVEVVPDENVGLETRGSQRITELVKEPAFEVGVVFLKSGNARPELGVLIARLGGSRSLGHGFHCPERASSAPMSRYPLLS